jgi:hypothetical protein
MTRDDSQVPHCPLGRKFGRNRHAHLAKRARRSGSLAKSRGQPPRRTRGWVGIVFDGRTLTMLGKEANTYAQAVDTEDLRAA